MSDNIWREEFMHHRLSSEAEQRESIRKRPWTHEQETDEMLRPRKKSVEVDGALYCESCGMMTSQCECWDSVNGGD